MRGFLVLFVVWMATRLAFPSEDSGENIYYNAILKGELTTVQKLVEEQPERVNTIFTIGKGKSFKMSALCAALQRGQKSIAEFLLSKGADPKQGPQGHTPLFYASMAGYTDLIPLLIQRGDTPNPNPEKTENCPLSWVKDVETAKALIACGANVNYHNKEGKTPLHQLSHFKKSDIAELLVQKGADVNAKDKWGRTSLHEAAWECQPEMAMFLLDHGADINACDNQNLTPLEYCVQERTDSRGAPDKPEYYKMLNLLISKGGRHTAEHLVRAGALERLKTLLKEQPEQLHQKKRFGNPLLLCAIEEGQAKVVEFLLQQGADANTAGRFSCPPLHAAVYAGNPDVVRLLLKAGADIHGKGEDGESALHWVAIRPRYEGEPQEGYDQISKLLIETGIDINSRALKARPDIWIVMDEPIDQIREFLRMEEIRTRNQPIQIRAPIWLAYNAGDTPLHSAARWGRVVIVRMLLDAGAKVDITNDYGQTALHYAIAAGHTEIVNMLLVAGASPDAKMKDGMSAMELAKKMNNPEAVKLLNTHRSK